MANFSWVEDAPLGVYKNHELSEQFFWVALAKSRFMDHVDLHPKFGAKKGETLTIPLYGEIVEPMSAKLSENSKIPEVAWSETTTYVLVEEFGQACPYSGLLEVLDHYDPSSAISRRLVDQQRLVLDTSAAAAFKKTFITYVPRSLTGGVFDVTGTPSVPATANFNFAAVEQIRDYLFNTLRAPGVNDDDDYTAIGQTLALRGIKRDPLFVGWNAYKNPELKASGEIGQIEHMKFIETNHEQALATGVGTGAVLGEVIVMGRDAVVFVEAETPELRASIPTDYGRQRGIAWVGVYGFDLLWKSAARGKAKVVYVTSQ